MNKQLTLQVKRIISEHYAIPVDIGVVGSKNRIGKGGTPDQPFVAIARSPAQGLNEISSACGRSATEALVYLVYEATKARNPEVAEVEESHKRLTALGVVQFGIEEAGLRRYTLSERIGRLRERINRVYERSGVAYSQTAAPAAGDVLAELANMLDGRTI